MFKKILLSACSLALCTAFIAPVAEAGFGGINLGKIVPKVIKKPAGDIQKNIPNVIAAATHKKEIAYGPGHINWRDYTDLSVNGNVEANPQQRMAHNIYSDLDLSQMSGKYSGFLIDFRADYAPETTYWALANWSMDTSNLPGKVEGGGAYCGLQHRDIAKDREWAYIMSFWDIKFTDAYGTHKITPRLVYPEAKTEYFAGEGEGSHKVGSYKWKQGEWYKMYLNCYDDPQTGHTIVEQWFQDISTGVWTKTCAFNTLIPHSYFKGGFSQFMENYIHTTCTKTRTCEFKNLYVRDYNTGRWQAVTGATLSVDTYWDNKKGSYYFGVIDNTLVGITNGYGRDMAPKGSQGPSFKRYFNIQPTSGPVTPN